MCGSAEDWSVRYTLRTLGGPDWSPTFAVYGDMGKDNAVSLPWLVEEASTGGIDAVLHIGDMAYNLFDVSTPADQDCVSSTLGATYSQQ